MEIDVNEQSKTVISITLRQKGHDAERITAAHIIVNSYKSRVEMKYRIKIDGDDNELRDSAAKQHEHTSVHSDLVAAGFRARLTIPSQTGSRPEMWSKFVELALNLSEVASSFRFKATSLAVHPRNIFLISRRKQIRELSRLCAGLHL